VLAGETAQGGVAHNEYLRLAVDTGVIGCGLYLLAVCGWIRAALSPAWRRAPLAEEYAMPALAVIAAWAVVAATDNAFDYYSPFTQFVAFLTGACTVIARRAQADAPVSQGPSPDGHMTVAIGGLTPSELGQ
jgi:O-antigen ligase